MSFYGNISNMSRTSFQFERTYSSRVLMDASAQTDGVFVGNYVLVDYDTEMSADWGIECYAYRNEDNPEVIELYNLPRGEAGATRYKYQQALVSSILYPYARAKEAYFKYFIVPGNRTSTNTNGEVVTTKYNFVDGDGADHDVIYEVYGHIGTGDDASYWYPLVRKLTEETSIYARNFATDKAVYNTVRGFDSTVWQKTYVGNPPQAKYVMIAELNSIVPTFDVTPEAPTMSPVAPHFDIGSTNFYYNLHWQPSWGFRVKSAINILADPVVTGLSGVSDGTASIPLNFDPVVGTALPSDETVRWTRPFFDKESNQLQTYTYAAKTSSTNKLNLDGRWQIGDPGTRGDLPAAIYYNKAGFNPEISVHSNEEVKNSITITPSGLSGLEYHQHGDYYLPLSQSTYDLPTSNDTFNSVLSTLKTHITTVYPDDQILVSAATNETYDAYGRDRLYKISNSQYVVATAFEENVPYYLKVNNTGSEMQPQVDTQEISIMLPSIGDSIADMWDLVYGGTDLNGGQYRNMTIKWLDGVTYFHHNGLRLIPTTDYGLGYDTTAVSTLAGAINSAHDLMGMIIRTRGEIADPETDNIDELSSAYIYYYPKMGKYYRRGTSYDWGAVSYNIYNPTTKDQEPFLVEQEIGTEENQLQPWPGLNVRYYYIEPVEETRTIINNVENVKYDYLIEQEYHPGWQYYVVNTPGDAEKVTVGRTFQVQTYYEYLENHGITYTDDQGNKISTTANCYIISDDEIADINHRYYTISNRESVGDNYRFFEYNANDITRQFYIISEWREATEPDPLDTTGTPAQIPITVDTYNLAPQKYYVYDSANDEYIHTTDGYDSTATYFIPAVFNPVTSIGQFRTLVAGGTTSYYTIEAKKTSSTQMYVQQTTYQKLADGVVTATNFNSLTVYTKNGNDYIEATTFSASAIYYTKIISWVLTDIPRQITAENATAVKLLDPTETTADGYPKYYYYNPVGPSGFAEYYGINQNIANRFTYQIVSIAATQNTGFYTPNTLYYRVESGPYAYSWVLDRNKEPTAGRQYYEEHFTLYPVDYKFYNPLDYYIAPEDLNQNTIYQEADGKLYKYSPLFVFEDNNDPPIFKKGDKWNMNVALAASDNIILKQYEEIPAMIELVGFARSMSTMNGSIARINEYMSANDTYTRSRKNFAGTINTMNDIIDVFKDIRANELLISNKYGQVYSRDIALTADNWITFTEDRSSDQSKWKITVQHKNVDNTNNTQGTLTNYGVTATQTPNFGATFDILTDVKRDIKGHLHTVDTTTVKIPLPSLTEQSSWANAETAQVITDVGLTAATGAFTYYKQDVGTLLLTQYSNTTTINYPTAGHIITAADSINTAFANLETYIALSDLSNSAGVNKYITSLTQTDGRIAYSTTTLINSSTDIVNDGSNKAQTAVSGQAVRQAINDLDSSYSNAVTVANGEYVTGYGVTIVDGLITNASSISSATFVDSLADNTNSLIAPQSKAVVTYVLGKLADTETNNNTNTAKYITSLSQSNNGKISYTTTDLLTTVAQMTDANTAGRAVSGTAVMLGINNMDPNYTVTTGNWINSIKVSDNKIVVTETSFYNGVINATTAFENLVPPTTEAVETYVSSLLNSTLSSWGGTANIVTLGTITTGVWNGTIVDINYGGTGTNSVAANVVFAGPTSGNNAAPIWRALVAEDIPMLTVDKIPALSAEKIGSGVFEVAQWAYAPFSTVPHTVTSNGETITTYPIDAQINAALNIGDTTTITASDTLVTTLQKLKLRIDDLEDYISAIFIANPALIDPRASN